MSKRLTFRKWMSIIVILSILSFMVLFSVLHCGVIKVTSGQIIATVLHKSGLLSGEIDENLSLIIWDIRLKRALLGFLVGMALSVSGCVFQALLRNPLADPHILGVSSGGALGAVLAMAFGIPLFWGGIIAVPFFSFCGSLGAIGIVYHLSKRNGALSLYSLLLVGVILNSFFISIVIFIEIIVSADQLAGIFFWLLGSLSQFHDPIMRILFFIVLSGIIILLCETRNINLLTLGEEKAKTLGVHVERTKAVCFIAASIITGLSVAVSGLIGFVGLVVPHIVRLLFGPDHRLVLPASALMGGIFLVVADTLARTILMPQELPVGVVTSFIGAPFFIILLKKREHKRIF